MSVHQPSALGTVRKNFDLYLLLIPGLAFLLVFKYIPMYGVIISFQDFNIFAGILGSDWVGLANYQRLFSDPEFYNVFGNTLIISLAKIIVLFPLPIVLAILLNEVRMGTFSKVVQNILYLPHFLSWVIVAGLFTNILAEGGGLVNQVIRFFGGETISFLQDNFWFRIVVVFSAGWKEVGWNTIVYLAALTAIDQEMYEAALIDGAGRIRRIISITLPSILSVIILLFILRVGNLLDAGFEQILMLYNPIVYETGDIIGTFVYRQGLGKMDYSFATAVGLFNSVVALILVVGGNALSKKILQRSIW